MKNETVVVIDFGGQYNQLIARRVREANVYCEVVPYSKSIEEIKAMQPKGIIFTGGPNSVFDEKAPKPDFEVFNLGVPVLGICYGAQLMSMALGGVVHHADTREYGVTEIELDTDATLFKGLSAKNRCLMSHTDKVEGLPEGFKVVATTADCPMAAFENAEKKFFGVQFHPEVNHTPFGTEMIRNFLYDVCGLSGDWTMSDYAKNYIEFAKNKIGDKKVLCALSGGVDSSVAAVLLYKAVGKNLTCIFVDHGLLRKDEGDQVEEVFTKQFDINLIRVNCGDVFLGKLKGVTEPETKRKIIGEEFIRVFEKEAKKIGAVDYLVQGTIYPDVIESGTGDAAVIKSRRAAGLCGF